jgi:hypothetical protein
VRKAKLAVFMQKYFFKTQEMQSYAFRTAKIFRRKIFLDQQCEIPSDDAAQNPNSQMKTILGT